MMWKTRFYDEGETRVINKFLLLPKSFLVGDSYITRWLEWVKIKQIRSYNIFDGYYWTDVRFVDE